MMFNSKPESLLPTARSLTTRQGSPVKGPVSSLEGRLVTVLILSVLIGVVTFWRAPGLPLPAVSPREPQHAAELSLAPVPVRRISDVELAAPDEQSPADTQPGATLSTQNDVHSTEDDHAYTDQTPPREQNPEETRAPENTADEQNKSVHERRPDIKPMNAQQLAAHEALINDILRNGAPSRAPPRSSQGEPALHLHPVSIEHNISSKTFRMRYGSTFAEQPVLIRDSQNDWLNQQDWRMEAMMTDLKGISLFDESQEECRPGQPDRQSKGCHYIRESDPSLVGKEWASLRAVDLELLGVSTYDELFLEQVELAKTGRYLYAHEISCSQLPQLGDRLHQPKYFRNNFMDLDISDDPDGYQMMAASHFPSFFFGPRGSTSPLHSDAGMTRFWILQLAGKKLVRLLPPSENSRASPTDSHMLLPTLFTADLLHPNFESHPGLNGAIVYEALLEPGDILHIPEGWPHQAINLEWSAMVSSNYIDDQARGNLYELLEFDEPDEKFVSIVEASRFFLPLVNASRDLGNIPMHEYFETHALELAEVSDAAKAHVEFLRKIGLRPNEWNDYSSRSLLLVAVINNYLKLAQWLVEEGMSLENSPPHRKLLKYAETQGMRKMSSWMRDHMGVPEDDQLADVVLEVEG